jgi:transposase InsO family protein
MSKHWMRKYPNQIKNLKVSMPEQVWVSDITYLKTDEGNCDLNLVTDAFSRKIMGYALSDKMDVAAMKPALSNAIKNRMYKEIPLIDYNNSGLQYCSSEYIELQNKQNIKNKHDRKW